MADIVQKVIDDNDRKEGTVISYVTMQGTTYTIDDDSIQVHSIESINNLWSTEFAWGL